MKKQLICFAVASLLLPGVSFAGDWHTSGKGLAPLAPPVQESCLSYDFIDLEYVHSAYDAGYIDDGQGFGFGFSKSLGHNFFLTGGFNGGSFDYNWAPHIGSVDTRAFRLGLGTHVALAKCVDLTFEGGATHVDAEFQNIHPVVEYDSWGYYVGPGLRARSGRLEVYAKALYFDRSGDGIPGHPYTSPNGAFAGHGWLFTPGMIFHLNEVFGIKVGGEFGEDTSNLLVGGRFHF
ncbi:MAG: hypothetical protein P1U85_05135 [Verrucomicrobiales bacterium]|nr:hypothetical protein [Verrucomicrobiales bacterium]